MEILRAALLLIIVLLQTGVATKIASTMGLGNHIAVVIQGMLHPAQVVRWSIALFPTVVVHTRAQIQVLVHLRVAAIRAIP